jgi:hypothetical protein
MNRLAAAVLAATTIVVACAEDQILEPRTPVPSLRASASLSGSSTANATVVWLGDGDGAFPGSPLAINAGGAIVGQTAAAGGLIFTPPPIRPIRTAEGLHVGSGVAINDAGRIVGDGGGGYGYVADAEGTASPLPVLSNGWGVHWANDISNAGDIVGSSRMATGFNDWHATLWRFNGSAYEPVDLGVGTGNGFAGNSDAYGIAPGLSVVSTLIVGTVGSAGNSVTQAFMWRNGETTLLPLRSESNGYSVAALDVADNGTAVGFDNDHAVVWQNGEVIDLHPVCAGLFTDRAGPSGARAIALTSSVPRRTLIVGTCVGQPAVWYDDGSGGYTAELLPLLTGDDGGEAFDVNAAGQVVGYTRRNSPHADHAVLWTFTPPTSESDNRPPVADAGVDQTVECESHSGTTVALDGSGSRDSDGSVVKYEWFEGDALITTGVKPQVMLALGVHELRLVVTDDDDATNNDAVLITVRDTKAPAVTLTATPDELRPPNHKYHAITVSASATDICDASLVIRGSVVSSEPDADGTDDGHTGDIRVTRADGTVLVSSNGAPTVAFNPLAGDRLEVRAERAGDGSGRQYRIRLTVTDQSGNSSTKTFSITVPHDRGN